MKFKLLSFVILIFIIGCKSADRKMKPGLFLTFDDRNMLHWEKQIPLFERYNAHVTFFIDHFDKLTPKQIDALNKLKEAGHAIECHGLRHRKAVEYCEKYSSEKYISEEITPALESMNKVGFSSRVFAYPNSNSNELTDSILIRYFCYLRSSCAVKDRIVKTEKFFLKAKDIHKKQKFYAASFHPKSKNDDLVHQAKEAIDRIKKNEECIVLNSHDIRNKNEDGAKNFMTPDALEELLLYAKNNQLGLYSFDELP